MVVPIVSFVGAIAAGVLSNFATGWIRDAWRRRALTVAGRKREEIESRYYEAAYYLFNPGMLTAHIGVRTFATSAMVLMSLFIFAMTQAIAPTMSITLTPEWHRILDPYKGIAAVSIDAITIICTVFFASLIARSTTDVFELYSRVRNFEKFVSTVPNDIRNHKVEDQLEKFTLGRIHMFINGPQGRAENPDSDGAAAAE